MKIDIHFELQFVIYIEFYVITFYPAEPLLDEIKAKAKALHMSQAKYIRTAIEYMNQEVSRRESQQKLKQASLRVRKESQRVNAEFSKIEHDPET